MPDDPQSELPLDDDQFTRPEKPVATLWDALYRLGQDALVSGKFFKFAFLIIVIVLVRHIESSDWVEMAKAGAKAPWFTIVPWCLWLATIVASVIFFRWGTRRMQTEIDRVVGERNTWQARALDDRIQGSSFDE